MVHNTQDITVIRKKTEWINDVAIPENSRIEYKELEKIPKYQDLKNEIEKLGHKPVLVISVVIGAPCPHH